MAGKYFSTIQSPWNQALPDDVPIRADSSIFTRELQGYLDSSRVTWWINRGSYSSPIYEVPHETPRVPVTLINDDGISITSPLRNGGGRPHLAWILSQGVPVPKGALAANGTDMHMAIVDSGSGELWEFWKMQLSQSGTWTARWGGYMADHRRNPGIFRDEVSPLAYSGWGSSATSLPIIAGMMLDNELRAGHIPHALQLVVPVISSEWWWPAQRRDTTLPEAGVLREGMRLRFPPTFNPSDLEARYSGRSATATRTLRMIATAIRDYGLIIVDRGEALALRAEPTANPYDFGDLYPSNLLRPLPLDQLQVIQPWWVPQVSGAGDGMSAG